MASSRRHVTGGIDTHKHTHHAAALDAAGRLLGDAEFPATAAGYSAVLAWLRGFGKISKVGVEGTGSYGASLARYLTAHKVQVVEVGRPDRKMRRGKGKSDPLDAIAAARAALARTAAGTPKTRTGPVEAIRALRVARRGAVKARTAALNQLHGLIITPPEHIRAQLAGMNGAALLRQCAGLPVDEARLADPNEATREALAAVAGRITALTAEITTADRRLAPVVTTAAPRTSALFGVGPDVAAQLLTTAGDNPGRLRSEAALRADFTALAIPPASADLC